MFKIFLLCCLLVPQICSAKHVIVCGGPTLRKWEKYRVVDDQHDRWWANFVRASTLRMDELKKKQPEDASLIWFVYRPGYELRGQEDGKPYITWITEQATKRNAQLIWFSKSEEFIEKMNSLPRRSITSFDYFGHSNKHAFLFEYGSEIMAASTAWFHEKDIKRIQRSIFARKAQCKSWGCHTGASMSIAWKKHMKTPLEGTLGKTLYTMVGQGQMPIGFGGWIR